MSRSTSEAKPPHPKDEKHPRYGTLPLSTSGPQDVALTGSALLQSPLNNKGSAFSNEERQEFNLHGLLPSRVQTLQEQVDRAYKQYQSRNSDLAKNTFMTSLKEQNAVLYYRLILDHLTELFPVIYTPTEGDAIAEYSHLFRKPEGCFLNIEDADRIEEDIAQFGGPEDIDIIVVSDGEQILGIGDQGVGAILISVAKLVIYTLCAGVHPARTLPVSLDTGTNNKGLLNDPLYLGLKRERVRGEEYDAFIDRFLKAARKHYPKAYIHFEDFGLSNARRILDKYQSEFACFNDDVQGTGCVTLAAIMSALHVSKVKISDARVIMYGSGTAGTGIADQIQDAMALEGGKSKEESAQQIWCVDKPGLLLKNMEKDLTPAQLPLARNDKEWEGKDTKDLLSIVKEVKPHILIGTSTQAGAFTEEVVREMAKHVDRPIILPLSNPTRLHEAKPADLFEWTDGKVLCATGSPFKPVDYKGKQYEIAECNNSVIYPAIGFSAVLCKAKLMTPALLVEATKALAAQGPALKDPTAPLLPDVTSVREISVKIASAVIKKAVEDGLAQEKNIPENDDDLEEWIREQMWDARYRPLARVDPANASALARGEAGSAAASKPAKD